VTTLSSTVAASSPAPRAPRRRHRRGKGVQVGERTADDRADRRAKPDSDPGGSHVAPVAAAEVHQRSDRQREGADGERAADDPDRERRPEAEFELGDCGERDVRGRASERAGDDQRCPSTERVARGAPDDRESNERTELRDEEPHPGVDTRGRPERDHQVRNPGVQEYLRDQHGEHDGAQPSPLAMVVLRHLLIKRAERSKDRRSGVSKHEAAQPCYSASSIAAAIVSAW